MRLKITGKRFEVVKGTTTNYEILEQLDLPNYISIVGVKHYIKDHKFKKPDSIYDYKPGKSYNLSRLTEKAKDRLLEIFRALVSESILSRLNSSSIPKDFIVGNIKCYNARADIDLINIKSEITYRVYLGEHRCNVNFDANFKFSVNRSDGYKSIAQVSKTFLELDAVAEKLQKDIDNLELRPFGIYEINGERIQL